MWYGWPYTDLHSLNLDWILNQLTTWKAQWEQFPNYIKEQIEQYLSDENLAGIVQNVLQEYGFVINVKVPGNNLTPAMGDGATDDTGAIQEMIAYGSSHGMPLLFPAGTYRVSGLNVNVDTVFMGSTSALMLMNVSSAPLISVSAKFECFGMTLNGNIGGQTTPQNVINCISGRFIIDNCHISSGKSGITGNVTGECRLVNSEISNFSEYGLYLEGSGYVVSSAVTISNVASGGALRFIKLDVSNSYIVAWTSLAEVATGIELTGDGNYIKASFPNVETAVDDGGQNNNWEVTGKSEKRYFNGNAYHAYQNLQENVDGDLTQNVGDFDGTASGHYSFSGTDVILNPTNPLTYKTPVTLNDYFNSIKFKSPDGTPYNVLVSTENTTKLKEYTEPFNSIFNVVEYGAKNDGTEDCSEIINSIISENTGGLILFPEGEYLLSEPITINKPFNVIGTYAYMDFQSGLHGSVIKFSGSEAFKIEYCGVQISTLCITSTTPLSGNAITFNDNTTSQSGSTINCTIKDVYIYNVNVGILQQVSTVFKTILEKVWVNTCNIGIFFTRGTSITLLNCWVTWAHNTGYNLTELTYSALINCACDNCYKIGYNIVNCNNIDILSCGCETTPVVAEEPPTAPAFFVQGSNLVHINVSFVNCRGLTGDQTAILVLTGSEQCIIDRCWIAGERTTTWFVFDNNGKNNVMFNTRNDVNNTFQARLNGTDVSLSQIITTKDAS